MELIKSLGGYENVVVCWLRFLQKQLYIFRSIPVHFPAAY